MRDFTTKAWLHKYLPEISKQFADERKKFEENKDPEKKGQEFIIFSPLNDKDPVNQIALIAMVDEMYDRIVELEARCQKAEDALAVYVLPPDEFIVRDKTKGCTCGMNSTIACPVHFPPPITSTAPKFCTAAKPMNVPDIKKGCTCGLFISTQHPCTSPTHHHQSGGTLNPIK